MYQQNEALVATKKIEAFATQRKQQAVTVAAGEADQNKQTFSFIDIRTAGAVNYTKQLAYWTGNTFALGKFMHSLFSNPTYLA